MMLVSIKLSKLLYSGSLHNLTFKSARLHLQQVPFRTYFIQVVPSSTPQSRITIALSHRNSTVVGSGLFIQYLESKGAR